MTGSAPRLPTGRQPGERKETGLPAQDSTTVTEPEGRRTQPAPWSTPGTWTITTDEGSGASGYLPAWAEDDPSEVGVPADLLPILLAEVNHRTFFEGPMMTIMSPDPAGRADPMGTAEENAVFEGSIDCNPYDPDPAFRVPVVNIQICLGHWLLALGPEELVDVASKLRAHADHLDWKVRPALEAAREDWAAHHPE